MINAIVTTELIAETRPRSVAPPLTVKLSHIHRRWMDETSQWLGPTLAPDADFWDGWSAVRYINDQFDRQYRRKCAAVAAILPLLRPSDALILCATTGMLERTRRDIDQAGRRQGMTEVLATLVYRFLNLLRTWLAEIERVTASSPLMNFRWTDGELSHSSPRLLPAMKAAVSEATMRGVQPAVLATVLLIGCGHRLRPAPCHRLSRSSTSKESGRENSRMG